MHTYTKFLGYMAPSVLVEIIENLWGWDADDEDATFYLQGAVSQLIAIVGEGEAEDMTNKSFADLFSD